MSCYGTVGGVPFGFHGRRRMSNGLAVALFAEFGSVADEDTRALAFIARAKGTRTVTVKITDDPKASAGPVSQVMGKVAVWQV